MKEKSSNASIRTINKLQKKLQNGLATPSLEIDILKEGKKLKEEIEIKVHSLPFQSSLNHIDPHHGPSPPC